MASTEPARSPKRIPSSRPPTLEELAAKLNRPLAPISSASNARPRLPANLLSRTNSSGQPTSATSPAAASPESASGPQPSIDALVEGTAAVSLSGTDDEKRKTADESGSAPPHVSEKDKAPRGYKNIPSLDAIAGRLARSRTETASSTASSDKDGSSAAMTKASSAPDAGKSPELEGGEIDDDQGAQGGEGHPLQHTWTLFHDSKARLQPPAPGGDQAGPQSPYIHPPNTATGEYEAGLQRVGDFNTVEDFCRLFNWLKPPSQLEKNSNYHLFKDGIKPMWEDPANAQGGKWVLTMRSNPELVDRCWTWLTMALVGEELDERDEVCGAVVSLRAKIDRIQLWLRTKDDIERINSIGKKLVKLLDLGGESGIGLEFQYNTEDRPTHTKFISIVPANQSGSFFRSRNPNSGPASASADGSDAPPASAPGIGGFVGGGMGSFSTGGSSWRGSKGGFQGGALGGVAGKSASAFLSHNRSTSASGSTNGGANTTQG
ncbi:hypothetical protein FRC04_003494 [Tulasnella sp. 424]|nr:hypothetical protein FRC04_003494 [Tulasnella sp. 424]KAG8962157.1 hypothetical protein FRC05_005498 [Tulasnella sp. 425]